MGYEEVEKILKDNKKHLNINEVLQFIFELKQEASALKRKNDIDEKQYYFYDGEVNAYCVCLDILEKFARD